jgi:hypothetical protein
MRAFAEYIIENESIDSVVDIMKNESNIDFYLRENLFHGLFWSNRKSATREISVSVFLNTNHDGGEGSDIIEEPIYKAYSMESAIIEISCKDPGHPLFLYLSDHPERFIQLKPISIWMSERISKIYEGFGPVPERFR